MKAKLTFIIIVFLVVSLIEKKANAQAPAWQWAKGIGGPGSDGDGGSYIAVDPDGNVYTTGQFLATVDFDPGPGVFNLTSASSSGIFISKLDSSGNFVWARAFGGTSSLPHSFSIALDGLGNIYTTGTFTFIADFDPGPGIFNLTSAGGDDIYISKLDSSGNFVWARRMGGTDYDRSNAIALDTSGNVFATGSFKGTADFDPGGGTYNLSSAGNNDIFISKLDSTGNFVWAKRMGGTDSDGIRSIAIDALGNIYTGGYYNGTVDFDPGPGTYNLTSSLNTNAFISKFNSSGNFVWAATMGGGGPSISLDQSCNVYSTGSFQGTADFDPGFATFSLTSAGDYDICIYKLDSSGNFAWAKAIGGSGYDRGSSVALDIFSNIYLTGFFTGVVDFDPGAGIYNLNTSTFYGDIFVSKLDSAANFLWAENMGGPINDYGSSIDINSSGNIYVTGYFFSPLISIGPIILTNLDPSTFSSDIFIAKLDHTITGLEDVHNNIVSLYPNPTTSHLTIDLVSIHKQAEVTIIDISGKIIYTHVESGMQKLEINTQDFSQGVYLLRIQTEDFIETKKIIITC